LEQTYAPRELIIVDDGDDVVDDLMPPSLPSGATIRYARAQERGGLGLQRNRCAQAALGDLFVLWDDDDWIGPKRIEAQVAASGGFLGSWVQDVLVQDEAGIVWELPSTEPARFFPGTLALWRSTWEQFPWDSAQDVGADRAVFRLGRLHGKSLGITAWQPVVGLGHYRVIRHGQPRTSWGPEGWVPSGFPAI
jgi:hypothetical protein